MIRRRIVLGSMLVVLFGIGWVAGRGSARAGDLYQNLDLFVEILHRVQENYVDPVEPEKLITGAMKGMLRDLDPYSQFLDAGSYQNLQAATHGSFGGIGVEVSIRDDYPTVISPIEGGPAWTLGIRSGDVITRIEGRSAAGLAIDEVAQRLRGPQGSHVQVSIRREGEEGEVEYSIERREIVTRSVRHAFVVEGRVGYVRLANFSETSGGEVRAALERLKAEGADRLVLDLRSNPGGLLDQAVDVAEQFVKQGTKLVSTRGRARGQDNLYFASEVHPMLDWPMVVLVDGASASASEIVAGSLQDHDRGLVVGTTSFGKGLVQTLFPLEGGWFVKLTTGKWYTPSGRSIQAEHDRLGDDRFVEYAVDSAKGDTARQRPVFKSDAGRKILGGGGITPDIVVTPDSASVAERELAKAVNPFYQAWYVTLYNYALEMKPKLAPNFTITPAIRDEFFNRLIKAKVAITRAQYDAAQAVIDRNLEQRFTSLAFGDSAAFRRGAAGDPQVQMALDLLRRGTTQRQLLALASTEVKKSQ